jgi:hypothetical protein
MRFLIMAATIALWAASAHAQGMPGGDAGMSGGKGMGGHKGKRAEQQAGNPAKKKVDDKDYNDALSRIPTSTEKHDPWRNLR